jgi:hypothetical protein
MTDRPDFGPRTSDSDRYVPTVDTNAIHAAEEADAARCEMRRTMVLASVPWMAIIAIIGTLVADAMAAPIWVAIHGPAWWLGVALMAVIGIGACAAHIASTLWYHPRVHHLIIMGIGALLVATAARISILPTTCDRLIRAHAQTSTWTVQPTTTGLSVALTPSIDLVIPAAQGVAGQWSIPIDRVPLVEEAISRELGRTWTCPIVRTQP